MSADLRGCFISRHEKSRSCDRLSACQKASQSFAPYGRERDWNHFRRRRVRRRKYFGFPMSANRTHRERRSSEMTELSALAGSEGYAACDDEASVELSAFGGQPRRRAQCWSPPAARGRVDFTVKQRPSRPFLTVSPAGSYRFRQVCLLHICLYEREPLALGEGRRERQGI